MKKINLFLISLFLFAAITALNPKTAVIARDKSLFKDGPGNYYDTISVLRSGTVVEYIEKSKEDSNWIQVSYDNKKGYISELALQEMSGKKSKTSDIDLSTVDKKKLAEITPAAYTAAIKGFVVDYSKKKGYSKLNLDELFAITEFNRLDFFKVMKEAKLAYFPKEGELIGIKEAYINEKMTKFGLLASISVLQQGVIMDKELTKKMNVIANIINRQTWDYDTRYRIWIIKDEGPVAFSGPGGYIFVSGQLLKLLSDYRELVAIIAHEVGHVALRHGLKDAALAIIRQKQKDAFNELQKDLSGDDLEASEDMEAEIDEAVKALALVRDIKEEIICDQISSEILRRYKIDKKYLISALGKIYLSLGNKYPQYKSSIFSRIEKLKIK